MQNIILSQFTKDELQFEISETIKKELRPFLTALLQAQPTAGPKYLTRKEAAKKLGISLVTLNDWTKTGKVIGYRLASRIRYKEDELATSLVQIQTRRTAA